MNKINISIDDVCPYKRTGLSAVNSILKIIPDFPDIKISLFVPTAFRRLSESKKIHLLTNYPDFVKKLKSLPPNNFEICYHGHFHCNKDHKSNNDEFRYFSSSEAFDRLMKSKIVFNDAGITPKNVFRPPGFWLSPHSFQACKKFGIKILALAPDRRYVKWYRGQEKTYKHVVYVGPQKNSGDLEIMYHAGHKSRDFLSDDAAFRLKKWLLKHKSTFSFTFLEGFYGENR